MSESKENLRECRALTGVMVGAYLGVSVGAIASGYCAMLISMPERRP